MKISVITLGCSKNLVDSEFLLKQLDRNGHEVFHDRDDVHPDAVILNTCGFILDAKQESIDNILHYAREKQEGRISKLLVMGCLSERYGKDLKKEIPEIDGIFGVWDQEKVIDSLGAKYYTSLANQRLVSTPSHYAFLKIAEGCNRQCAFCAIPGIRGRQRSKSIANLKDEAEHLVANGARELMLIAQDLTSYGIDLEKKFLLPELLKELSQVNGLDWIRMHYAYPTSFPEKVIDLMANDPKICNYIDIPIQHINDRILKSMRRGHNRKDLEKLLWQFRDKVPGVALRTTVLTGFPGETEEEYRELLDFIREFKFDRLGVFPYSHEEDTPAAILEDDVPEEVKASRADEIMAVQQEISLSLNEARIGKTFKVLLDEEGHDYYIGRTEFDSPEVDNEVLIEKNIPAEPGHFYEVEITDAGEFDLIGKIKKVL